MFTRRVDIDRLAETVIGAAIEVHRTLGPGLLENVYRECLMVELAGAGLVVEQERRVPLRYKGQPIKSVFRLDLLVEDSLVVELKAVEIVNPVHLAQVITYLKLTGFPAGLLMNFNVTSLRTGLRRLNHPDRHVKKCSHPDLLNS